jgi:imidazolonepropionase
MRLVAAARVVTSDPARATTADPLGVLDDGAIAIDDGRIAAIGPRAALARRYPSAPVRRGRLLTPGLIDAHTHAPWMGSRHAEYALRMEGASYEAIASAGGGIVASMRAVREASLEAIVMELRARLRRMATLGVTTVEAKSGYGLDAASEHKQLTAIAEAAKEAAMPHVVPTFLALHALPPEARGDRDAYAAQVATAVLPAIARAGLARYVDAYVDRGAFSMEQARPVLERARALGLGVRLHAGQFADVGGAELAAELGADSVDHLEHVSPRGIDALARAGTCAVLLPVASFTLGQAPPPIAALRAAGVPLVVASDANPGTAPTESLPLALALAVRLYGLTMAEAILGATREAARSLGLGGERGILREGLRADAVLWDLPHESALVQPWGVPRTELVLRDGETLHELLR